VRAIRRVGALLVEIASAVKVKILPVVITGIPNPAVERPLDPGREVGVHAEDLLPADHFIPLWPV
jgi:hypothetical protein